LYCFVELWEVMIAYPWGAEVMFHPLEALVGYMGSIGDGRFVDWFDGQRYDS